MVAQNTDSRRHAANVYASPDGRQWVLRDDYEALMAKATLTVEECRGLGGVCGCVKKLLDGPNYLADDERAVVSGWLAAVEGVVYRLAE